MPYSDIIKKRENHKRYMQEVWYPANKAKHIALVKVVKDKNKKEASDFVNSIKLASGCVDCGIKDVRVLDFDHLRDKSFDICAFINRSRKFETIKDMLVKEIAKCEVVCSNCHRIRTFERRKAD